MEKKRILMQGFYGYANFGDDVLMEVTHKILREALPTAEIILMTDAPNAAYIAPMLGQVVVQPSSRHAHFDIIIHGGGGVFFDFMRYGFWSHLVEKILMLSGLKNYLRIEKIARRALNRPRITTARRLGLGIGVGGFSEGSPYLRNRLHMLAEFDALWLRDARSEQELKRYASVMHDERIAGSDLAFLTQYWLPEIVATRAPSPKPRLGIALRDWVGLTEETLGKTIALFANDYDISGFILDAKHDPIMQRILAPYPAHIWQPAHMSIADFTSQIAAMDVLLTSRAHAAICGACVGVPSVIVNIEPKMEQVHAMLPSASRLVGVHDASTWAHTIAAMAKVPPILITADAAFNRAASAAALEKIKRWFV